MSKIKTILSATIISIAGALISTNASAAVNGLYAGGQAGYGNIHQGGISIAEANQAMNNVSALTTQSFNSSNRTDGIAGRLFAGYQVNTNFAAEAGFTKFSNEVSDATFTTNLLGTNVNFDAHQTISAYAVDVVGKGIVPLQNGFSAYGKLGVAYLKETGTINATISARGRTVSDRASSSQSKIYPTFGAGVSYDLSPNLVTDVSWNRIQKLNSDSLPSTDLFGLGLAYHFG